MNHTMHGIIFSYGKPTGLGDLIAHRIPGSMPFGGNYRVVDFMLSSMVNAGIHDVGVIMHGKCQSMLDHLGNGRSWDLSRNRGGLTLLPAFAYAESRNSAGRFRGKVEALGCVLEYLREIRQEYVVLADSDLVINLPLLIAAWYKCGAAFTVRTLIVTVLSSAIIDGTARFLPPFRGDKILVALFGGVLAGAGLGLIYLRGATTGGSEVVARLLERRLRHIPIGRLILLVDAVVVAASALVYKQLESALYAMVLIFVSTSIMDAIVYGGDTGRMLLVMSRKEELLCRKILEEMGRGVTLLNATGAYTGEDKRVLLCAVRRSEMYQLRTLVQDCDPDAFLIVVSTEEVLGEGFKRIEQKH